MLNDSLVYKVLKGKGLVPRGPGPAGDCRVGRLSDLPVPIEARDYREHLLLRELRGYDADLVCLQEVTTGVFDGHLRPLMAEAGLEVARSEGS